MGKATLNTCPLCGKENPVHEWACEACGAQLPMHGQKERVAVKVAPARVVARTMPGKPNRWALGCGALFFFFVVVPLSCDALSPPAPAPMPVPVQAPAVMAPVVQPTPLPAPANPCAGATAICSDGTKSYAAHHQGACSHHGGVQTWCD